MRPPTGRGDCRASCVLATITAFSLLWSIACGQTAKEKEDNDPFIRVEGRLIEKLIVVKSGADIKVHPESGLRKDVEPPKPFSVFWRLKTGTPGNEKDGYYLAGNPEGDPVCWIRKDYTRAWQTRFVLEPILPSPGIAFKVFSDAEAKNALIEFVGEKGTVPAGYKRLAIITGMGKSDEKDGESTVYPVTIFTARLGGEVEKGVVIPEKPSTVSGKGTIPEKPFEVAKPPAVSDTLAVHAGPATAAEKPDVVVAKPAGIVPEKLSAPSEKSPAISEKPVRTVPIGGASARASGLDVVYVIGTVRGAEPLVEVVKAVSQNINNRLAKSSSKGIVRFGIVEYRDKGDEFVSRVTVPLDADWGKVQDALAKIQCKGGESGAAAVNAGVDAAIENAGWGEMTSKHIIVLGGAVNRESVGPRFGRIIRKASPEGKSTPLGGVTIHTVVSFKGNLDDAVKMQFRLLSQGDLPGYFGSMDASDPESKADLIKELSATIQAGLESLAVAPSESKPAAAPPKATEADSHRPVGSSDALGDRIVYEGYARTIDQSGKRVATVKILVTREDLRRYWSGLDGLLSEARKLKRGQGNPGQFVRKLRQLDVSLVTGERANWSDAELEDILQKDIPLRTKGLRLSIAKVAVMEPKDFDSWLELFAKARKHAAEVNDDAKQWSRVNEFMGSSGDITFLEYSELP